MPRLPDRNPTDFSTSGDGTQESCVRYPYGQPEAICQQLLQPSPIARFAMELAGRFGAIAGNPDGEDSAGRQKLRLMTPDELVERCFQIASLTFSRIETGGFYTQTPSMQLLAARQAETEASAKETQTQAA